MGGWQEHIITAASGASQSIFFIIGLCCSML